MPQLYHYEVYYCHLSSAWFLFLVRAYDMGKGSAIELVLQTRVLDWAEDLIQVSARRAYVTSLFLRMMSKLENSAIRRFCQMAKPKPTNENYT